MNSAVRAGANPAATGRARATGELARTLLARARRALAAIPVAARVCALLACLNAACWSLITPPFQVTDEYDHFAYAQQEKLQGALSEPLSRVGQGGAGVAASQPPLYYALETVPYYLGSKATILVRLQLMRLLSALMAGITALFAFLFLREALPRLPWAWTVGGLGVALAPLLGFVSGGVNPDAMLFAVSAALFYCLARGFRRGLSQRLAMLTGALIAVGLLTKLNFLGLVPGALLGLALLARRAARASGRTVYYRRLAPALAIAVLPGALYALVNVLSHHAVLGVVSSTFATVTSPGYSPLEELSYIWQLYLPRLPGMHNDFGELFTTRQIWFRNMVGLYGWTDTVFPTWVNDAALIPAGLLAALCVRELVAVRTALRERAGELAAYAAMTLGVLVLIGAAGYRDFPTAPGEYAEPRYLLPLLALWGAALALAARGAGRRWGQIAGVVAIVLVIAHDLFSQLQTIARYYG